MIKKLFSVIMICVLLMTVAACGKKSNNDPVSVTVATEATKATEQMVTQEETKAATLPTLSANFELPEGESVESWDIPNEGNEVEAPEEDQSEQDVEETVPVEVSKNDGCGCAYAEYLAKSPAEQEAYMNTFASPIDFIEWSKAAEAEHSSHVTVIEASGSELNIGDYIK